MGLDADIVARRFDLGRPLGEPVFAARGELGRIWRLDTDRGRWAVKELLDAEPGDGLEDARYQLALRAAGIPLPQPVASSAGEVIARAGSATVRVYEWVDLEPSSRVPAFIAGSLLAGIHAVDYAERDIDPWYVEPRGEQRWREVVRLGRADGRSWAPVLEGLLPDLLAAEVVVVGEISRRRDLPGGTVIRCHLDFNPENVAMTTGGGPVVLDWENSGGALPAAEVAQAVWDFAAWPGTSPASRDATCRSFVEGYREAGGVWSPDGIGVFAMAFVVQGHLLEFYGRRAVDHSATEEDRARSERWLAEMTASPLTIATAELVLEVCG